MTAVANLAPECPVNGPSHHPQEHVADLLGMEAHRARTSCKSRFPGSIESRPYACVLFPVSPRPIVRHDCTIGSARGPVSGAQVRGSLPILPIEWQGAGHDASSKNCKSSSPEIS
jgi:hypothetical protein